MSYFKEIPLSMNLEEKLETRLKAAKFRLINQKLYKNKKLTNSNISFYHSNYNSHTSKWPNNPLDKIIPLLNPKHIIADLGCGKGQISSALKDSTVHSFDLYPSNSKIIKCDMKNVPLENESVDDVVFCLSLMKDNVFEFIKEANRILKINGCMFIAEVQSRVDISKFVKLIQNVGFKLLWLDKKLEVFFICKFKKIVEFKEKEFKIPMKECKYKKR